MSIFIGILALLTVLSFLGAFVGLISPKYFVDKKTGVIPSRRSIFMRGIGLSLLFSVILGIVAPNEKSSDGYSSANNTQAVTDSTIPHQSSLNSEANKPTLNFNFEIYRKRVNADLKSIQSKYSIPTSLQPESDSNAVNDVATVEFSARFSGIISINKQNKNVQGITILYAPKGDAVDLTSTLIEATILLTAANGDDGNKRFGDDVIGMISDAIKEFTDANGNEPIKKSITRENVKYSIILNRDMPIMMFAEPINI